MKNIRDFYLKIFSFLGVNFSIYLNRRVFEMNFLYMAFYIFQACATAINYKTHPKQPCRSPELVS